MHRFALAAAAALALLVPAIVASPAQAQEQFAADGKRCTIVGTPHADVIRGTSHADVICGLGGDDTILGGGGDDIIDGGPGDDRIFGGGGDDVLIGGSGNDTISGGSGDDRIDGGTGADVLNGGSGNDRIDGGAGSDAITGGSGVDQVAGGSGSDEVAGGPGNDRIDGGTGADVLNGGSGADVITGDSGADTLNGDSGADHLNGGTGADELDGGTGSDVLVGGGGKDECDRDSADASVSACPFDDRRPVLLSLAFDSTALDRSSGSDLIHVTAHLTDRTAVQWASVVLVNTRAGVSLALASGTVQDGTWTGDIDTSTLAAGQYRIGIGFGDVFGHRFDDRAAALPGYTGPTTVTLLGAGAAEDTTAPAITGLTVDRSSVDGSGVVAITVQATDAGSGVHGVSVSLPGATGSEMGVIPTLTSGSAADGTWSGQLWLSDLVPDGTFPVVVTASDGLSNESELAASAIPGYAGPSTITHTGASPAASDTTPPSLVSLSLDRTTVDTSTGDAAVQVTMHLTDDLSGVAGATLLASRGSTSFQCSGAFPWMANPRDLTLSCVLVFPHSAPDGAYSLYIEAEDGKQNLLNAPLATLGSGEPSTITNEQGG